MVLKMLIASILNVGEKQEMVLQAPFIAGSTKSLC